jgi:hypothetical protein
MSRLVHLTLQSLDIQSPPRLDKVALLIVANLMLRKGLSGILYLWGTCTILMFQHKTHKWIQIFVWDLRIVNNRGITEETPALIDRNTISIAHTTLIRANIRFVRHVPPSKKKAAVPGLDPVLSAVRQDATVAVKLTIWDLITPPPLNLVVRDGLHRCQWTRAIQPLYAIESCFCLAQLCT